MNTRPFYLANLWRLVLDWFEPRILWEDTLKVETGHDQTLNPESSYGVDWLPAADYKHNGLTGSHHETSQLKILTVNLTSNPFQKTIFFQILEVLIFQCVFNFYKPELKVCLHFTSCYSILASM